MYNPDNFYSHMYTCNNLFVGNIEKIMAHNMKYYSSYRTIVTKAINGSYREYSITNKYLHMKHASVSMLCMNPYSPLNTNVSILQAKNTRFMSSMTTNNSSSRRPVEIHHHKANKTYVEIEEDIALKQQEIREYYNSGDFARALEIGIECRDLVESHFGKEHPVYASTITNIALMYKSSGQLEAAIESYEHALKVYKESVGDQHASFATTLFNLGATYRMMAQTQKGMQKLASIHSAKDCFQESLKIRDHILSADHPDIALSLCNIGLMTYYENPLKPEKAIEILQEASSRLEVKVGNVSPLLALAKHHLAFVLKESREYERAIGLYKEVVDIRKNTLGEGHHETIMAKHNLAEAYRASGNETKAVEIQNALLAFFETEEEMDKKE